MSSITLEARLKTNPSLEIPVDFTWTPIKAKHHEDETGTYYMCGAEPSDLTINVTNVASVAAGKWRDKNAGVTFPKSMKELTASCSIDNTEELVNIYHIHHDYAENECGKETALACVQSWSKSGAIEHYFRQEFRYVYPLSGSKRRTTEPSTARNFNNRLYMPSVFLHEVGHIGGVAHTPNRSAIMYKTAQRSIKTSLPTM